MGNILKAECDVLFQRWPPMASVQAKLVIGILRLLNWRKLFQSAESLRRAAAKATPCSEMAWEIRRRVRLEGGSARIGSVATLTPTDAGASRILYIYGGAWVFPAHRQHWR